MMRRRSGARQRRAIWCLAQRREIVRVVGVYFPRRRREVVWIGELRRDAMDHPLFRPIGIDGANDLAPRIVDQRHPLPGLTGGG